MNEKENTMLDQLALGDEELDLGSFDGFDPFEQNEIAPGTVSQPGPAADSFVAREPLPADSNITSLPVTPEGLGLATELHPADLEKLLDSAGSTDSNPLQQAIAAAEEKDSKESAASLFSRPPLFCHGGVSEEITNPKMTFEQLREEKSRDFSELEDSSKVTWTMEYGKTIRPIQKPNSDVIFAVKKEIETSKAFLEALRKKGGQQISCKVKPKITAQKKGIASYMGVFTSWEELKAVGKPISILLGSDGKVYEIRRNELGTFIAPTEDIRELPQVRAGFQPALPPIPFGLFSQIVGFFRSFLRDGLELEALVHVYWDKDEHRYQVVVPRQLVGKAAIDAAIRIEDLPDDERYLHFADIHSHNTMAAEFSLVDDMDEKSTRVYIVVGQLDHYFPQVSARVSCNGKYVPISASQVIAPFPQEFPTHWSNSVKWMGKDRMVA